MSEILMSGGSPAEALKPAKAKRPPATSGAGVSLPFRFACISLPCCLPNMAMDGKKKD
jgi:hypothetical protein